MAINADFCKSLPKLKPNLNDIVLILREFVVFSLVEIYRAIQILIGIFTHSLQIHVGVELHRVPELLFQPSMIGSIEAGLVETIDYVLKLFSAEEQMILVNNVFFTGSCCKFPGLKERLERELTECRPFKSTHKVTIAEDPSLDSWMGARQFTLDNDLQEISVTRAMYDEFGGDYLKVHAAGNKFFETPSSLLGGEPMEGV